MLWYFSDLKVILLIMHGCIGMTNDETNQKMDENI